MNAVSDADAEPSDTLIFTPLVVPVVLGVPLSLPVLVLKLAQDGLFAMANVSVLPSGSFAVGVNEYAVPTLTEVGGVPLMVGGRFVPVLAGLTSSVNAGRDTFVVPSVTEMVM